MKLTDRKFVLYDESVAVEKYLLEKLARTCIKNSRYDFTGGQSGGKYFDVDSFYSFTEQNKTEENDGKDLVDLIVRKIKFLCEEVGVQIDKLAFLDRDTGPVGMIAYKSFVENVLNEAELSLDTCVIRPSKRLLSSCLKGRALKDGEKIAVFNDVSTDGDAILEAAGKIWQLGGEVSCAIVVFDRCDGARENLAQYDIDLYALFDTTKLTEDQDESSNHIPNNTERFVGAIVTS